MKNSDLNILATDFWRFFLQYENALNRIAEHHGLTRTDLLIFAHCQNLTKQKIPISTIKLRGLGFLAPNYNYPRSLKRLTKAGLIVVSPIGKKHLFYVSSAGQSFHSLIEL